MKKALVFIILLLFCSNVLAVDLNVCEDLNGFEAMGNCIMRGAFISPLLFSILTILFFTIILWQANCPAGASIGIGLILFFSLGAWLDPYYQTLANLAVLSIGVMVGLAILHFIRR